MLSSKTERFFHRCLLVPAFLLAMGPSALAGALLGNGEYFVSGAGSDARGDGSEGNPWRTITHAVDQAGGGQPVIFVGPGLYDAAAGEQYPIEIAEDDDLGAILLGTGDYGADAAIIDIAAQNAAFRTYTPINGTVVVSGFVARGDSSGPYKPALLEVEEVDFCVVASNEVTVLGLLEAHMHDAGEYIVAGNSVLGCNVGVDFEAHSTGGEGGGIDLLVLDNQFLGANEAVYVEPSQASDTVYLHLEVVDNLFVDCSTALWVDSSMTEHGEGHVNVQVRGNEIEDCGYGLWFSHEADYHAEGQRLINVKNNTIDASYTAIGFSTSVSTGCVLHQGITVHANKIASTDGVGIYQSLELEYEDAEVYQDLYIGANIIEDCYYEGVYLFVSASYTDDMVANDVVIDGNTIRGCNQGIDISEYHSYTAYVDANYVIRHNAIKDNWRGIDLSYTQYSSGSGNITYDVRGNCLTNNSAYNMAMYWYADTSVAADVALEAGTWSLMGYNTIGQPSSPKAGGSSTMWVSVSTTSGSNVLTADLVGNWWGTMDPSEIQDRIYDGNDNSGLIVANAGNPLDDNLEFTVAKNGGELRLDAGQNAGFVAYAGRVSPGGPGASQVPFGYNRIKVLVDGELQHHSDVTVADDFRSLTFPIPSGSYDIRTICVINPCGQMGCVDYSFCDGNDLPSAIFDDVETEVDTPVLIDLLANDTDPENGLDPTTLVITQAPEHGTLVLNPNGDNPGEVLYTPDAGWTSCDTFNYTVSDTCGAVSNVGTAQVCIVNAPPPNHAPKANYDSADTDPLLAVTIDVLANDSDVDGDGLDPASVQIEWAGSKGEAVVNLDGTVTYTPYAGTEATTDTFNYSMADVHGARSNIATVQISISGGSGKAGG